MSDPNDYTVGWICAIETELVAAASFLDEEHSDPNYLPQNDDNSYVLGRMGRHNVVIAALPNGQYGLVTAATVARNMVRSFPNVRIGLMVGIGGGAPSPKNDIRLGDVVVSSPSSNSDRGGVFQYDYGRTIQNSVFDVTGHLNQPPQFILAAISTLRAQYRRRGHGIGKAIEVNLANNPRLQSDFQKPTISTDRLYDSAYRHAGTKEEDCTVLCDASQLARNPERPEGRDDPTIHYGIVASANQLMRDAILRDKLAAKNEILCFEMEAAGLMNHFPCVIIRGICDYSDTHKSKVWQGYAAMVAAAYAKDLLGKIVPNQLEAEKKLMEIISSVKEEVHEMALAIHDTKSDLRTVHDEKHVDDVTKWLCAPDVSSNFNKAREACHPGSGQSLISNEVYSMWKFRSNSFLWLYGIPGSGKTILTSTIIDDLRTNLDRPHMLVYFYFDFTDSQKQTIENCIGCLLDQLYYSNERAREEVDVLYAFCKNGREQPSKNSLQETFAKIARSERIWIVLDALDECKARDDLLGWLRFLRKNEMNIHIITTSRPEHDIKEAMEQICQSENEKIEVHGDLLKGDIQSYVRAIIKEHEDFRVWRLRPNIQEEIETSLVGKAHGMFRWVWCQLRALRLCRDPISLRNALASLPRDLDETYSRILDNVPSQYFDHTIRILQFLTYSDRPLHINEAVDAIAVTVGPDTTQGSRFDLQNRMPIPDDIVGYCSSLAVVVVKEEGNTKVKELQLAHFSVKDYLTSDRLGGKISLSFQETLARSAIAEVCLAYLLDLRPSQTEKVHTCEDFIHELHDQPNKIVEEFKETFPFAHYSARYWAQHAVYIEHHRQQTFELAKDLLFDRPRMQIWYLLYDPAWLDVSGSGVEGVASALYYASLLGLPYCSRTLLDEGADVHAQGGYYGSALQVASARGHNQVVRVLLHGGADVNRHSSDSSTPLLLAAEEGHQEVVRILLEKGAEVDVGGSEYWTPLARAAANGHEAVVRMLLGHNAQVDYPGWKGYEPLAMAAAGGYNNVVTALLEHEAEVNGIANTGQIPILSACRFGHTRTVELLIKHGAIIRADSLFDAARYGFSEIMKLLLAAGADYQATDNFVRSALTYATIHNQPRAVEILLVQPGLDVNMRDHWGTTALSFAARFGFSAIFQKMAASANADLYAQDRFGRTPLWWAQKQKLNDIASYIIAHHQRPPSEEAIQSQTLAPAEESTTFASAFNGDEEPFCDVCMAVLGALWYRCSICQSGSFALCSDCHGLGAHCLVQSHTVFCHRPGTQSHVVDDWWVDDLFAF